MNPRPMLLTPTRPSTLVDVISNHARAYLRVRSRNVAQHQCCRPRASYINRHHNSNMVVSPRRTSCMLTGLDGINSFRQFSDSSTDGDNNTTTTSATTSKCHRRVSLKSGRARRKWQLKQREEEREDSISSTKETDTTHKSKEDNDEKKQKDSNAQWPHVGDAYSNSIGLTGNPIRDRYIRSQQKIHYPKTWAQWKIVLKSTWNKYLWTFEGDFLKVKKRDAYGNILQPGENEEEHEDEEKETLQDKAKEAADQISSNVEKNISTMKEEAPKLLKIGQKVTGISTKEELREWVGEQLKLGTVCLSEFMKGYRKGRDDEVDRMLHEYFKDLDETEEPEKEEPIKEEEVNERLSSEDATGVDATPPVKRERRSWGRRERRKLKSSRGKVDTTPIRNDELSKK